MKRSSLLLLWLCLATLASAQNLSAKLDTVLNYYARKGQFNGSALVAYKGTVVLTKGYGFRDSAKLVKNDENSIFQLGSITKQFTSTIILRLQEEKKLNVNERLSKYFPSYPKGDSITIAQLMSHTSGIFNYTNDRVFMQSQIEKHFSRDSMLALFQHKPLEFSPGSKYQYSNSNYMLLGYIIEDVTKMPYYQAARRYLFTPLKMTHTGFDFTRLKSREKATGYFTLARRAPIVDSSISYAAGAAYSTTGDLYKWHQGMSANRIISAASATQAYMPVLNNYGFGWVIDSVAGKRKIGHGGGIHGFNTTISRIPEDEACIILLSNVSNSLLNTITDGLWKTIYLDAPPPADNPSVKVDLALLEQYKGNYTAENGFSVMFSVQNGELHAVPRGQNEKVMAADGKDSFYDAEEQHIKIKFNRDDKDQVNSFTLTQSGRQMIFKKD
ncbi:beta-lactamase family protein [Chitinophaga horti]|uniref:Beta-lactamase family protein n=1 Tax=Chitinophaga horti TaxID=2920382 RepID=A0ABY6J3X9_9BACT|nr:serine hydrolase domain-containing protein [Chitinophaga horti]UYQ94081.1 beta-lactamase family protein [Chitinophaga horti]